MVKKVVAPVRLPKGTLPAFFEKAGVDFSKSITEEAHRLFELAPTHNVKTSYNSMEQALRLFSKAHGNRFSGNRREGVNGVSGAAPSFDAAITSLLDSQKAITAALMYMRATKAREDRLKKEWGV